MRALQVFVIHSFIHPIRQLEKAVSPLGAKSYAYVNSID